ncbi:motility associated factor glycosyltransferase family protein [Aliarcobacter cryaerophilus]|uniref:motility associated factor glycosyltransferase family protein n=1 Tax=Aliarcobacter cryaerophilus TaxID=28198 RepID=UPI0008246D7D|nr:6-hydroxymethylpterin diphosphokinase MptE-like protein [Aliarcobacter cryaerophilus]
MTEAQIQLQNALTTTFLANLVFLSEYDKDLYHRVDELSRMIENGTYEEKYHLEFIMEDGDFDVYDVVNEKYLYDRKPTKRNEELINKINFDIKESIFVLAPYFTIKDKYKVDYEKRFELEKLEDLTNLTLKDIQEYTDFTKDYLEYRAKKKFKRVDKFIFMGTLLGRHIPKIANKINASSYLILERNLEIFRLSLFTVDYTILGKKGAIFSIMDSTSKEEKKIYNYLSFYNIDNYLLKLSITNINIDKYIDIILNLLSTMSPTAYDYNRYIYVHTNRTTRKLQENYKFLNFNSIKENSNLFENIPILYIAAGPSLDDNLEWVKKNQNKFFIVCIGRALKKLVDNEIRVDVVTTIDEQDFLADTQFDDATIKNMNKNTILFASSMTNDNVLNKFDKKKIYLFEAFLSFFNDNDGFTGFSVGEATLDLLLRFNPKKIYILGLDLALNQKTGDTHASGDKTGSVKINLSEKQDRSSFEIRKSLVKVKGNFKKEVYTTPLFYSSIKFAEDKLRNKDKNIKVYNLSENGARFEGTIPKKINEINLNNFEGIENIQQDLEELLLKSSYICLDKNSKKKIKYEINFLIEDIKDYINILKHKENIKFEEFLKDLEVLLNKFKNNKLDYFYEIILVYCKLYFPYLSYYFNDKNIKAERNKVNKIKEIFVNQITKLLDDYIECLKRVV